MNLLEIPAQDFDLAKTLDSGQVFHWEKVGRGFLGAIGEYPVYAEQGDNVLRVRRGATPARSPRRPLPRIVAEYFALDHPLAEICASFPDDPIITAAQNFCGGLRIIRQPKWECLATFICSSMKQVAHIRQISKALRERFGVARSPLRVRPVADNIDPPKHGFAAANHYVVHVFPSARRLANSSENELRECGLGYRAKNLLATARRVSSGEADLEAWSALSDLDLQAKLCELPGVGAKVANCVMLFAYERLRAFPIDVWIERVLRQQYFPRARKLNAQRLRKFCEGYFGEHGGYAQQYLFHYARIALRKSGASKVSSTPLRSARNDTRKDGRMGGNKSMSKRKIRARAGVRMGLPRRRKLSVPSG
jgi:N-glycosylase/DNA lyase